MTRVVLEVISEAHQGKKLWLQTGQVATVGRTDDADFVLPYDRFMSSAHFLLECGPGSCSVRDLRSHNGMFLNGQKVAEGILRDKDQLVAGRTTFRVHIEGARLAVGEPEHEGLEAGSGRPSAKPIEIVHGVGNWAFGVVPPGWEPIDGQGLSWVTDGRTPCQVMVSENCLPEGACPKGYIEALTAQLKAVPGIFVDGPRPIVVQGAEEAVELVLRQSSGDSGGIWRQIYARRGRLLGTATFTAMADQFDERAPEFDLIVSELVFGPTEGSPGPGSETVPYAEPIPLSDNHEASAPC